MTINNIPDAVLSTIITNLSTNDLHSASLVCKRWNSIILSFLDKHYENEINEFQNFITPFLDNNEKGKLGWKIAQCWLKICSEKSLPVQTLVNQILSFKQLFLDYAKQLQHHQGASGCNICITNEKIILYLVNNFSGHYDGDSKEIVRTYKTEPVTPDSIAKEFSKINAFVLETDEYRLQTRFDALKTPFVWTFRPYAPLIETGEKNIVVISSSTKTSYVNDIIHLKETDTFTSIYNQNVSRFKSNSLLDQEIEKQSQIEEINQMFIDMFK